jgi:glycosyltransferase involved in cell wall biosynthesis
MKTFAPKFSFIIPVRNESKRIDACLRSIRNQDYPAELIEILVPDQASEDDTRERARSYGARVTENPAQRAIFSMPQAFEEVRGDLIVTMAADNRVHPQFCKRMAEPFQNPDVAMAFPFVTTDRPDYATAVRYINRFTDPFNHFVYGDASNPRDLARVYTPVSRGNGFSVYCFPKEFPPLLAIAQAAVLRAPFRMPEGYADDVAVVFGLLESGKGIACVETALVDHYTATSLRDVLRKFRRIIAKNFKRTSSLRWRDRYVPEERLRRRQLWPLYAASIVAPCAVGVYRALRDREILWLYHPVITLAFAWITFSEALKNAPDAIDLLRRRRNTIESAEASKE